MTRQGTSACRHTLSFLTVAAPISTLKSGVACHVEGAKEHSGETKRIESMRWATRKAVLARPWNRPSKDSRPRRGRGRLRGSCQVPVGIQHVFDRRPLVETLVALRGIIKRNDLGVDDVGDR